MFSGFLIPLSHAKEVYGSSPPQWIAGHTGCYLNQHVMVGVCMYLATQGGDVDREAIEMTQCIRKLQLLHLSWDGVS